MIAHAQPRFDEGADEPWPDGALMIAGIARRHASAVVGDVTRLVRRKRAQPERRQEPRFNAIDNLACLVVRQEHERQAADGEDLIWAKCWVGRAGLMIAIDDIVKIAAAFIPKARFERHATGVENRL